MDNSFIFVDLAIRNHWRMISYGANLNSPKTLMALSLLTQWLNWAFFHLKDFLFTTGKICENGFY
jgi:hypothetical protein